DLAVELGRWLDCLELAIVLSQFRIALVSHRPSPPSISPSHSAAGSSSPLRWFLLQSQSRQRKAHPPRAAGTPPAAAAARPAARPQSARGSAAPAPAPPGPDSRPASRRLRVRPA